MNFSAVILAGGKSSRMGRDKAFLEWNGEPLLARQIRLARTVGAAEIFISGRPDTDYSMFGERVLRDQFPESGPLAGLHAALVAAQHPLVLALAVDMPDLSADFLRRLIQPAIATNSGVIPECDGHIEPLVALYPKSAASYCAQRLRDGQFSACAFAQECVAHNTARFIGFSAEENRFFLNVNSAEDFSSNQIVRTRS